MYMDMTPDEFRAFATDLCQRLKTWIAAWQAHPLYDGNDRNPYVRATCYVLGTVSYSIERLQGAYGQFARMSRKHMDGEPTFRIEPIHATDAIDPIFVLDYWKLTSKWSHGCESRKAFKKVFPKLARVVNEARRERAIFVQRDPVTKKKLRTKKQAFEAWLNRNPEHLKEMKRC